MSLETMHQLRYRVVDANELSEAWEGDIEQVYEVQRQLPYMPFGGLVALGLVIKQRSGARKWVAISYSGEISPNIVSRHNAALWLTEGG